MSVEIKAIVSENQYEVNGKVVYKSSDNVWIETEELTVNEKRFFREHIKGVESKSIPGIMSATYME